MTVRSDKVELVIEAKDEASRVLKELFGGGAEVVAEMRAEIEALQRQYSDLVGVQRGQANTVHELSSGNKELTDQLREQAEEARALYQIELELGSRAASTEKERIALARQGLAMEHEVTRAQAEALGATNDQLKAIDGLFLRLDLQIQAQEEANAATTAGASATTAISTGTRAAAFATGVLEKALVSVKRALFIAPLVAVFQELIGSLSTAVTEMLDFGDASDHAADAQERLKRSLDASREAMEGIQKLNFARTLPGAGDQRSDRVGLLDTAIGRVQDPTQFPNGISAKELLEIAGPLDLTLLQGYQAELKKRDDLIRGLLDQGRFGELVQLTGVRFSGQVSDSRDVAAFRKAVLDSVTQDVLISREEAISALERRKFDYRDRIGTPSGIGGPIGPAFLGLEDLGISDVPPGIAATVLPNPTELAGMLRKEVTRLLEVQITNLVDAGLAMSHDGLGGQLGAPSLLGLNAPTGAGGFNLDVAIAAERTRLSEINRARQDQLQDEEKLRDFTAERMSLMGQLELSQGEQVDLLRMQVDAQRQAVGLAREAGQINSEQEESLMELLDRLEAEGMGRISRRGAKSTEDLLNPTLTAQRQFEGSIDALDDRGVSSLADAFKQTAANIHDADAAAKAFGLSMVNALMDIAAQWAALQVVSTLFGPLGGGLPGGQPNPGGGSGTAGVDAGGSFGATEFGGGTGGGYNFAQTFGGSGGYGGASGAVQIHVHVAAPQVYAMDSRDVKARLAEHARFLGDTVARELDTNASLKQATRKIARSAG